MAESMNLHHKGRLALCLGIFVLGVSLKSASVYAEVISDPTRPPNDLQALGNMGSRGEPILQSILLSPGRKGAIINGEMIPLGGKFGDARLVKITETAVVLQSAEGTKLLKLYPAIEKNMISKTPSQTIRHKSSHSGKSEAQ